MLNLSGILDVATIRVIHSMVKTKYKDYTKFKTPESLILFEQGYLSKEELFKLCQEQYEVKLYEPKQTYIPTHIVDMFNDTRSVPIQYNSKDKRIVLLYVPEYGYDKVNSGIYNAVYVPTTLHYFIHRMIFVYGSFKELNEIDGLTILNMIFEEAIKQDIPDLTISSDMNAVIAYYNKSKMKEMFNYVFPKESINDIIKVLTIKEPIAYETDNRAKYVGYEIDSEYRARVVINRNIYGYVITIRLFSNELFSKSFESLNINKEVINFFRNKESNKRNGIRVIVGETMSGKNHLALAHLSELVAEGRYKIVSIEMPVEQRIAGVEQIDAMNIDEYKSNIESLIHQNPDFVYITETKDETGLAVMRIANTGKRVLTTLHSNSVEDTISRIVDITGLSSNRVIQNIHSIIHQELVNIDGKLYPKTTFVEFTDELKMQLYDQNFGEIIRIISERKKGGLL